jgi:hypothetical protein
MLIVEYSLVGNISIKTCLVKKQFVTLNITPCPKKNYT